jgi:membrane protein implicated in regulation of membrane protease activity
MKYKKPIIMGICITWGMLTAFMFLLSPGTSPLSIGQNFKTIFYPVYCIATIFSALTIYLLSLLNPFSTSNTEAYIYLFVGQFVIYLVLGIIISYVIYPLWEKLKTD